MLHAAPLAPRDIGPEVRRQCLRPLIQLVGAVATSQRAPQGTGSAVLRWFNMQSISEVKSQLECMHLIFGAPRFICSREFRRLYLKAETRQAKTKDKLLAEGSVSAKAAPCAEGSYGDSAGLEAQENCTACPAGSSCVWACPAAA